MQKKIYITFRDKTITVYFNGNQITKLKLLTSLNLGLKTKFDLFDVKGKMKGINDVQSDEIYTLKICTNNTV